MWNRILSLFKDSPSQQRVVRFLIENGLGISEEGKVNVNGIEVSASALARVIGVDRRVVDTTIKHITGFDELKPIFMHLKVTPDLTDVAKRLGLSVIVIVPKNAGSKYIVASAVSVIAQHGLNIRQIFVTDPYFVEKPKLVIIIDGKITPAAIEELSALESVESITI